MIDPLMDGGDYERRREGEIDRLEESNRALRAEVRELASRLSELLEEMRAR